MAFPDATRTVRRWLAFWGLAALIMITIPLARSIEGVLNETVGKGIFLWLTVGALVGVTAWAVRYLIDRKLSWDRWAWLLAALAGLGGQTWHLRAIPAEAFHVLQYGGLGGAAFWAVSARTRSWLAYPTAIVLCALVGTTDEIVQWLTPDRHWEYGDVAVNVGAATLAQILIAGALRPAAVQGPLRRGEMARLVRLGLLELLILAATVVNTPPRVAWYAPKVPGLGFLHNNPNVMNEYGYRHEVPGVGSFYSRMTTGELAAYDAARAATAAAILDGGRGGKDVYREFLAEWPPGRDPFLHEARVHLYRRDVYLERWQIKQGRTAKRQAKHAAIALKEHRILQHHFGRTLSASTYAWPATRVAALADAAAYEGTYVSPVSENVWVGVREGHLLGVLALLALLLGGVGWLGRRLPEGSRPAPPASGTDR